MIEQIFVNDELAFLKRERELFRDYEGELLIYREAWPNRPLTILEVLSQPGHNTFVASKMTNLNFVYPLKAHLESLARSESKLDSSKDDCAPDYFAFGENSPKQNNQDDLLDSAAHSRDVDDWLLSDKWGKSRYPSVPDSEAATAIESILNDELS